MRLFDFWVLSLTLSQLFYFGSGGQKITPQLLRLPSCCLDFAQTLEHFSTAKPVFLRIKTGIEKGQIVSTTKLLDFLITIVSQKMLATFIISVCIFEGCLAEIQKLTNIDYVGLGYDVLIGNPHNDLYDPGDVKRFKKHSLPTLTN